jgi:hypothetical protein
MKHLGMQHPLLTASITKGVLSKERVIWIGLFEVLYQAL